MKKTKEDLIKRASQTEELRLAFQKNDILGMRTALENGADANSVSKEPWPWTMLFTLCSNPFPDVEKIKLLLSFGANPDGLKYGGEDPLLKLCSSIHDDQRGAAIVELFIRAGVDVAVEEKNSLQGVLFTCASRNKVQCAKLLLEADAPLITGKYSARWHPLQIAVERGHFEMVDLLVNHPRVNLEISQIEESLKKAKALMRSDIEALLKMVLEKGLLNEAVHQSSTESLSGRIQKIRV